MASLLGGLNRRLLASAANRKRLPTHIRGYCQEVSADTPIPIHRVILFFAGGASAFACLHVGLRKPMKLIREREQALKLKREALRKGEAK